MGSASNEPADAPEELSGQTARVKAVLDSERVRYVLVGAWNTAFGYGAFVVLQSTLGAASHYVVALLAAHVISVLVAFVGYRLLVFRVQGRLLGDLWRFWTVYAGTLVANVICLPFLVEVAAVPILLAQAVFLAMTVLVSYLAHSTYSFRRPAP